MPEDRKPLPDRPPQAHAVRRSLAFSMLDRYAGLLVNIVSTMLLARLLTPHEVGIFSVAMAMLMFAATVRDMGAGTYLVQEKELTRERIQSVWALQLGLGVALAALVAGAAVPASAFYREPALEPIMWVLALNYLVNPFGSLTYAWLMREMRYGAVALMRFGSTFGGACLSVGLAWSGHGAISLAWGSLCTTVLNALIAQRFRPKHFPWMPALSEVRRVLGFGGRMTASSMLNTVTAVAPEFLLGRLHGMAAVGYFSRANGLVQLFSRLVTDAVYPVALSLFSQQNRQGMSAGPGFIRACSYMSALCWAFCACLAVLAEPTIVVLYGAQWTESVHLARWLTIWAGLSALTPLCIAALVGAGRPKLVLRCSALTAAAMLMGIGAGSVWGPSGTAIGMATGAAIGACVWIREACREMAVDLADMLTAFRGSALLGLIATGPAVAALWWSSQAKPLPLVVAALGWCGSAAAFAVGARMTTHPIGEELRKGTRLILSRLRRPI